METGTIDGFWPLRQVNGNDCKVLLEANILSQRLVLRHWYIVCCDVFHFHRRVAQTLLFLRYKFNPEILMPPTPPEQVHQTRVGWRKQAAF